MALGPRLACASLLLLAGGCAHRAYYVFGPESQRSGDNGPITVVDTPPWPHSAICQVDFRGVVLGRWTVDQLRTWHWNTQQQPPCEHLKLRFHSPGTPLTGEGIKPRGTDVIRQIAIDSNPERPHLADAAVIRAIVSPEPARDRSGDGTKGGGGSGGGSETTGTPPATTPDPAPMGDIVDDLPPPPPPPQPTPSTATDEPRVTAEKESSLDQMVAPAIFGGGLVYALAFFQLLPMGGAAAAPRPRLKPPAANMQDPPEVGAGVPTSGDGTDRHRDPRVRVRVTGFARAPQ